MLECIAALRTRPMGPSKEPQYRCNVPRVIELIIERHEIGRMVYTQMDVVALGMWMHFLECFSQ